MFRLPSSFYCAVYIWAISARLLYPQSAASSLRGTPSKAEQQKLLAAMGQYAEEYVSSLPNFLCTQEVGQYEAGRKPTHWRRGDTITFKLAFNHGHEDHSLELVNNKPVGNGQAPWRRPLVTEGEFGLLLARIFATESAANFDWNRWEMLAGREVAVFSYSISQEHSSLKLTLSDIANAIVPYDGSIYADPATGSIWRVTSHASEIPSEVRTKSISTTIDYDEIPIGSQNYLLPVRATVRLTTNTGNIRNEIRFSDYRKFEADSTITYTSQESKAENKVEKAASQPRHPPEPN